MTSAKNCQKLSIFDRLVNELWTKEFSKWNQLSFGRTIIILFGVNFWRFGGPEASSSRQLFVGVRSYKARINQVSVLLSATENLAFIKKITGSMAEHKDIRFAHSILCASGNPCSYAYQQKAGCLNSLPGHRTFKNLRQISNFKF